MAMAGSNRSGAAHALRSATSRWATPWLAILACAASVFALAAQGAEKYRATPIGATAADKISDRALATQKVQGNFTVGDHYSLTVTSGGVMQAYGGRLLKVSDHWIVLRDYSITISTPLTARLGKIPLIGDWVRRSGEKPGQVDRWIPREAVTVVSHRHALNPVTIRTPLGNQPPIDQGGRIELARGGKIVSPKGDLTAISGNTVTLLNRDEPERSRELLARRDILCISYYGRCLDPNEAE